MVTGDPSFPTLVICQDPQLVALSSPSASSGVFELDTQSDLLFPFEGTGVDSTWFFDLPPAGNPFDFRTLIDVVMTVDYTAQFSAELRDRVVRQTSRDYTGDRTFSVRQDLPDAWYDIANGASANADIVIPLSGNDFPPALEQLEITEVSVTIRRADGQPCAFQAAPSVSLASGSILAGASVLAVDGLVSSRRTGGSSWHSDLLGKLEYLADAPTTWKFELKDGPDPANSLLQQLRASEVDDILIAYTFSGLRPRWN